MDSKYEFVQYLTENLSGSKVLLKGEYLCEKGKNISNIYFLREG
jgi:hypothetical protein